MTADNWQSMIIIQCYHLQHTKHYQHCHNSDYNTTTNKKNHQSVLKSSVFCVKNYHQTTYISSRCCFLFQYYNSEKIKVLKIISDLSTFSLVFAFWILYFAYFYKMNKTYFRKTFCVTHFVLC